MLIKHPPFLLCLTSKELETKFSLSSRYTTYKVCVIPPQGGDIPNKIEIFSRHDNKLHLTLTWDEGGHFYRFFNESEEFEDRIFAGEYRIVVDRPGAIVYMTPNVMGQIDYSDVIHIMADAIGDLQDRIDTLEGYVSESKDRFEQIEADISA